jgi:hypothetical protein
MVFLPVRSGARWVPSASRARFFGCILVRRRFTQLSNRLMEIYAITLPQVAVANS